MRKTNGSHVKKKGSVDSVYTTRTGTKKVGIAESCRGVIAWKQVTPSRREKVHYGIIPPHQ